jgi:hypothetical protein
MPLSFGTWSFALREDCGYLQTVLRKIFLFQRDEPWWGVQIFHMMICMIAGYPSINIVNVKINDETTFFISVAVRTWNLTFLKWLNQEGLSRQDVTTFLFGNVKAKELFRDLGVDGRKC